MVPTASRAETGRPLISSHGNNKLTARKHISQAGFTLVEVMTVLVIIGLMSSAVVLTWPEDPKPAKIQAETLISELNAISQSAMLSGQPKAAGISKDSYALYSYEQGEWTVKASGDWDNALSVSLNKDNVPVKLHETLVPLIIFEPTGISNVFTLEFEDRDSSYRLSSVGDGRVVMDTPS